MMDGTGLAVGMEWEGHTYRGGSAGNAHKPNSNKYRFLEEGRT